MNQTNEKGSKIIPLWVSEGQKYKMMTGRQRQLRLPFDEKDIKGVKGHCIAEVGDIIEVRWGDWFDTCEFKIISLKRARLQDMSYYDWCNWTDPDVVTREAGLESFVGINNQMEFAREFCDRELGFGVWEKNPMCDVVEFIGVRM